MSLKIKPTGTVQSSRQWSCSTLQDGADQLIEEAKKVEDEEMELMKLIQDWFDNNLCCLARLDFVFGQYICEWISIYVLWLFFLK